MRDRVRERVQPHRVIQAIRERGTRFCPHYLGAGIGTAMLFVLFTYGGWNDAAMTPKSWLFTDIKNTVRPTLGPESFHIT